MQILGIKRLAGNKYPGIARPLVSWVALWLTLIFSALPGKSFCDDGIAVVVSKKIKPYIQIGDGIVDGLSQRNYSVDVFILNPKDDTATDTVARELTRKPYRLVTTVGPEATVLVWGLDILSGKIYTAVLDPGTLSGVSSQACGIPLRIPVLTQIKEISQQFGNIKKIGLLFDPRFNQWFYEQARLASLSCAVEVIPLQITSRNQISKILGNNDTGINAIWMIPDQTVISEKIIQYVIKQGIYHGIGVIGYNSFFTRSGALFSFEFDYTALGHQTARKIDIFLKSGECVQEPPVFKTMVNKKIADKTGIRVKK